MQKKAIIYEIKDWIGLKVKGLEDPLRSFESEVDLNTCLRSFFVFKSGSVGFPILSASALLFMKRSEFEKRFGH